MKKVIMKIVGAVLALAGMLGFVLKAGSASIIGSYMPAAGGFILFMIRNHIVLLSGSALGLLTGICWENG